MLFSLMRGAPSRQGLVLMGFILLIAMVRHYTPVGNISRALLATTLSFWAFYVCLRYSSSANSMRGATLSQLKGTVHLSLRS